MGTFSTEKSKKMYERSMKFIPGGASSASRTPLEGYKPYPIFIEKAEGSKLYDIDGNVFIDYLQALGPTLVGNANPKVIKAVSEEIKKGVTYGLPFELQIEVAEKLIRNEEFQQELMEMINFRAASSYDTETESPIKVSSSRYSITIPF